MSLKLTKIIQEPIGTNCYVISDDKGSIIIDPGSDKDLAAIKAAIQGKLYAVILTHLHYDHSAAAHYFDVPCYIHEKEFEDIKLQQSLAIQSLGEKLILPKETHPLKNNHSFGDIHFEVIHTPGHTKGGVCLLFEKLILTGDTLFAQNYGRTDIGGNDKDMLSSLLKLATLKGELIVYPGHGEATTINKEKRWILDNK